MLRLTWNWLHVYFVALTLLWIALVMYVPLSLKISKDVVCCCLFYSVLIPPVLINKARNCHLLGYCLLSVLLLNYCSGAKLQSSLDLGGQRAGWEDMLTLPLCSLTPLVVRPPVFFFCWLTCPGMLFTKLNCFPFSSHFYLTIILCFCFFLFSFKEE